ACAVHHAVYALALLGFYRDHEALATDGDQLVLNGAAFGQPSQISAQRLLNEPLLLLHVATNAAQLRRSTIVKRAVRLDLVAEMAQQQREIGNLVSQLQHAAPVLSYGVRRMQRHLAPL